MSHKNEKVNIHMSNLLKINSKYCYITHQLHGVDILYSSHYIILYYTILLFHSKKITHKLTIKNEFKRLLYNIYQLQGVGILYIAIIL